MVFDNLQFEDHRVSKRGHADCHFLLCTIGAKMLYLLWAVAGVLVFAWLFAVGSAFVTSGWIHVLLVAAVLAILANLFTPSRSL
jgi:hypothetical protein